MKYIYKLVITALLLSLVLVSNSLLMESYHNDSTSVESNKEEVIVEDYIIQDTININSPSDIFPITQTDEFIPDELDLIEISEDREIESILSPKSNIINSISKINTVVGLKVISYTEQVPIRIENNSAFTTYSSGGDGSSATPYIIDNYNITSNTEALITITNTTAHFILQNNYLNGLSSNITFGVLLSNVTNGKIVNNTIHNCSSGIRVNSTSKNIFILNNSIHSNLFRGVDIFNTLNTTIANNYLYNNYYYGLVLKLSNNSLIFNNTIYDTNDLDGICLKNATNNEILNNTIFNNGQSGIVLWGYSIANIISYNEIYDHSNDAIRITTAFYDPSFSSNNIISYNSFHNNYYGLGLMNTLNNSIFNNDIYESSVVGIFMMDYSNNNSIFNNIIDTAAYYGIWFVDTNYHNLVTNNTVRNINYSCICFTVYDYITGTSSEHNIISNNNLSNSTSFAGHGIELCSNSHNNVLVNNTITNCSFGIYISGSDYNMVENNTINLNREYGIRLYTSDYNMIENNTINSIGYHGIYLYFSNDNRIENNTFNSTKYYGIYLNYSNNNVIVNNFVSNTNGTGIFLFSASYNQISKNICFNSARNGISANYSDYNIVDNNIVSNSSSHGIYIYYSDFNSFSNNILANSTAQGFYIDLSTDNDINNNIITNNSDYGLSLFYSTINNIINNTISNNNNYGIYADDTSNDNLVIWNNFINNDIEGLGSSQGCDNGTNNLVIQNYWDEWNVPDANADGFVDNPYQLDGSANNEDEYPLTTFSYNNHYLAIPVITYPNGGEVLNGIITIQWIAGGDTLNHSVTYAVYYSDDVGSNWILLTSGLSTNSYDWNTTETVNDGTECLIKVVATCSEGLSTEDISDNVFLIHLPPTEPVITYPNGGEEIYGIVTIQWEVSIDSLGHSITYDVFYSSNGGFFWSLIASDLLTNSYDWNTTAAVSGGTEYLIKVVATCSEGLTSEDVSDNVFAIHCPPTIPTITYPNNGETLSGTVTIQWYVSTSSLDHSITYNIYYSENNGTDWILLTSDLVTNSYEWNTTETVNGGTEYLIKIVATCSEGLFADDVSDNVFTIHCPPTIPTITYPNGGETLFGTVTIQWEASTSSLGHLITYDVYYSEDGGLNWTLLTSGLSTNSYDLNTTLYNYDTDYKVKIVATCSEGLTSEDVSNNSFTIHQPPTEPTIIYPNGGENISETITIQWTAATDPEGLAITYDVYYSVNEGIDWNIIAQDLETTSFDWDTTANINGVNYLIRVLAKCSDGVYSEDISDNTFEVLNAHILTIPTINYPIGGETLFGTITIQWEVSTDTFGHSITYDVYYSDGTSWVLISTAQTTNYFDWDTNTVINGNNYKLKVVATCSEGFSVEYISDNVFTIQNAEVTSSSSSSSSSRSTDSDTTTTPKKSPGLTSLFLLLSVATIVTVRKVRYERQ